MSSSSQQESKRRKWGREPNLRALLEDGYDFKIPNRPDNGKFNLIKVKNISGGHAIGPNTTVIGVCRNMDQMNSVNYGIGPESLSEIPKRVRRYFDKNGDGNIAFVIHAGDGMDMDTILLNRRNEKTMTKNVIYDDIRLKYAINAKLKHKNYITTHKIKEDEGAWEYRIIRKIRRITPSALQSVVKFVHDQNGNKDQTITKKLKGPYYDIMGMLTGASDAKSKALKKGVFKFDTVDYENGLQVIQKYGELQGTLGFLEYTIFVISSDYKLDEMTKIELEVLGKTTKNVHGEFGLFYRK